MMKNMTILDGEKRGDIFPYNGSWGQGRRKQQIKTRNLKNETPQSFIKPRKSLSRSHNDEDAFVG